MTAPSISKIALDKLEPNIGQIEGVPENPRTYTNEQMEAMIKSLKDLPEMLDARPLIVYPINDKYVVIGGNRRYDAANYLKYKEIPCYVLEKETKPETIRAYLIKDNMAFGDWDYSKLIEDWDIPELESFGFDKKALEKNLDLDLGDDEDIKIPEVYQILITCENEDEQQEIFEKLESEGINCKIVNL